MLFVYGNQTLPKVHSVTSAYFSLAGTVVRDLPYVEGECRKASLFFFLIEYGIWMGRHTSSPSLADLFPVPRKW